MARLLTVNSFSDSHPQSDRTSPPSESNLTIGIIRIDAFALRPVLLPVVTPHHHSALLLNGQIESTDEWYPAHTFNHYTCPLPRNPTSGSALSLLQAFPKHQVGAPN